MVEARDARLVQTAVTGSPDSEDPIILPTGYRELDTFREQHVGEHFWCGELLGGCGRELTTKKYVDRICHFAHIADIEQGPSVCSRGADSADHLYVLRDVGAWLRSQGLEAQARLLGNTPSSGVEFELRRRTIRVHPTPITAEQWRADDAKARADGKPITWLVAGSDEAEDAAFDAGNPAMKVRMQDAGTAAQPERRLEVGTRGENGEVDWDQLEECELDNDARFQTPSLQATGRREPARRRSSLPVPEVESPKWTPPAPQVRPRPVGIQRKERTEEEALLATLMEEELACASELRHELRTEPVNARYVELLISTAVELIARV